MSNGLISFYDIFTVSTTKQPVLNVCVAVRPNWPTSWRIGDCLAGLKVRRRALLSAFTRLTFLFIYCTLWGLPRKYLFARVHVQSNTTFLFLYVAYVGPPDSAFTYDLAVSAGEQRQSFPAEFIVHQKLPDNLTKI